MPQSFALGSVFVFVCKSGIESHARIAKPYEAWVICPVCGHRGVTVEVEMRVEG